MMPYNYLWWLRFLDLVIEIKIIRFESSLMREDRTDGGLAFFSVFSLHVFIFFVSLPRRGGSRYLAYSWYCLTDFLLSFQPSFLCIWTGFSAYLQSSLLLTSCAYFVLWQFVVTWRSTACIYMHLLSLWWFVHVFI